MKTAAIRATQIAALKERIAKNEKSVEKRMRSVHKTQSVIQTLKDRLNLLENPIN